jgi:hypothetical protein
MAYLTGGNARAGDDYAELKYEIDEYRVSQITLIMSGELVSVREFTGELEVVDFGLSCMSAGYVQEDCFSSQSFEAASNDGMLSVTLRNIGQYSDMYTVSFPFEGYEFDNGVGLDPCPASADPMTCRFIPMSAAGNADLSPMQVLPHAMPSDHFLSHTGPAEFTLGWWYYLPTSGS